MGSRKAAAKQYLEVDAACVLRIAAAVESIAHCMLNRPPVSPVTEQEKVAPFGELAAAWFSVIEKRRVCPANERKHIEHMEPLAALRGAELSPSAIDEVLTGLLAPMGHLSPQSVNKVRRTGRRIIRHAQKNVRWGASNPFELVESLKVPKKFKGKTLTLDEVRRTLARLRSALRALALAAVLTGMRPGEIFALEKDDVDLELGTIWIHRSHGRPMTKTGEDRTIVIHRELLPVLREAMAASKSKLVFPGPNGKRWPRSNKLAKLLCTALKRAGVALRWRYRCRKYSCAFDGERVSGPRVELPCPECAEPMWSVAVPKRMRFYDLRHTSATLYEKAGTAAVVISVTLGHAPGNTTDGTYKHLDDDYCRQELARLSLVEE